MAEQLQLLDEWTPPPRRLGPIEAAWADGDDLGTVEEVVAKCARMLDESESCRDVKALSITVLQGVGLRREMRMAADGESEVSALDGFIQRFAQGGRAAS